MKAHSATTSGLLLSPACSLPSQKVVCRATCGDVDPQLEVPIPLHPISNGTPGRSSVHIEVDERRGGNIACSVLIKRLKPTAALIENYALSGVLERLIFLESNDGESWDQGSPSSRLENHCLPCNRPQLFISVKVGKFYQEHRGKEAVQAEAE